MNKEQLLAKIEAMKAKKVQAQEEIPQTYNSLQDMESAVNEGEVISLLNMANLVNKPKEEAPTQPTKKYKLVSFKILWSEATSNYDNVIAKTWKKANELMLNVGRCATMELNMGYDKTKVEIIWENGHSITDRLDLSLNSGDFNPFKQTIQEYLKPQNGVMYDSNLMQGDRETLLSWEDEEDNKKPEPSTPPPTEPNEQEIKLVNSNLSETPELLKALLGITDTIEESNDRSETALLKASEQVEKCKAYIVYLKSILPILEAKTESMIESKHKPQPIKIQQTANHNLN